MVCEHVFLFLFKDSRCLFTNDYKVTVKKQDTKEP